MYAIIQAGGHQYQVKEGSQLKVDFISGKIGDEIKFEKVLMVNSGSPTFGTPLLNGALVSATIKEQSRGEKIKIFKYKRRKAYKRTRGHRQLYTLIEINTIKI